MSGSARVGVGGGEPTDGGRLRLAVVSGGNRGIGLEVGRRLAERGWRVLLGSRDAARGQEAANRLAADGLDVEAVTLDVTDAGSVEGVARTVDGAGGQLAVLVNNAGVYPGGRASTQDPAAAEHAWQVNALGPWRLTNALAPALRRTGSARVVNVSSEAESLAAMDPAGPPSATPAYDVSKAALNAVTRVLAADLGGSGILVNAVCPGWVATDMGGAGAPRSVAEGAASVLWAVDLLDGGPTGGFFRDGRRLPW